jgi:oxygen-independent coproporphyrinogen-3 oxidase
MEATGERPAGPGLYVHVPFCSSICPYCDFAVLKGDGDRRRRFIAALVAEIGLYDGYPGRFDTIYFGGGTPSILEAGDLERILVALEAHLEIAAESSISLEANPEDVDDHSLSQWRDLGIDTLSLGIQSFDARELSFLGRRHDPDTARRAVEMALGAGFRSVSLDLIYGLPEQSKQSWRRQLDAAVELEPQHISCYQLTVHEKTVFGVERRRGMLTELAGELQAEYFFEAHRRLAEAGYEGYEVSNFSRATEYRSRHNAKYWDHTPYLGLGPSAHSFDGSSRWWNEWKEGPWSRRVLAGKRPIAGKEKLSKLDLALERLMLGLRTSDGVDVGEIDRAYDTTIWQDSAAAIEELGRSGKLEIVGRRLTPTLEGLAIADSLALAFDVT